MVWLHTFLLFWVIFSIAIVKWVRWYFCSDERWQKDIPFPFYIYVIFIMLAIIPAYIVGIIAEFLLR